MGAGLGIFLMVVGAIIAFTRLDNQYLQQRTIEQGHIEHVERRDGVDPTR